MVLKIKGQLQVIGRLEGCISSLLQNIIAADITMVVGLHAVGLTGRRNLLYLSCRCVGRCGDCLAALHLLVTAQAVGVAGVAVGGTGFFRIVTDLCAAHMVFSVQNVRSEELLTLFTTDRTAYIVNRKILTGRRCFQVLLLSLLGGEITVGKLAVRLQAGRASCSCEAGSNAAGTGFPVFNMITTVYRTLVEMELAFRSPAFGHPVVTHFSAKGSGTVHHITTGAVVVILLGLLAVFTGTRHVVGLIGDLFRKIMVQGSHRYLRKGGLGLGAGCQKIAAGQTHIIGDVAGVSTAWSIGFHTVYLGVTADHGD